MFIVRPASGAPGSRPSDSFLNYDGVFKTRSQNDRDWPITIIWYGEASKAKVVSGLGLTRIGNPAYEPFKLTYHGKTDVRYNASEGKKTACSSRHRDTHIRLYGQGAASPDGNRFYDPTSNGLKWFVVSSTHFDHSEEKPDHMPRTNCFGPKRWFGRSEEAAASVENLVRTRNQEAAAANQPLPFGQILVNQFNTKNREGGAIPPGDRYPEARHTNDADRNHLWSNDGLATEIYVP